MVGRELQKIRPYGEDHRGHVWGGKTGGGAASTCMPRMTGVFEELDSDSDGDGYGVQLDGKFRGDELHFTGADLGMRSKRRKTV